MKSNFKFYFFLILTLIPSFLYSQNPSAKDLATQAQSSNATPSLNQQVMAGVGFSQIEGDSYVLLNIGYEFSWDKIGLGVQLPLNLLVSCNDDNGCDDKVWNKIRKADWDEFSDYLTIIRYFRYGQKFDESNMFYARFGELGASYIGHATIVSNFLNSISWNSFKPGLQFDVYTPWGGIETITDDISSPGLMGTRLFVRPLTFVFGTESYFSNFALGTSFIGDRKAKSQIIATNEGDPTFKYESLMFYSFDMEFRVFKNKYFTVVPYMDFNFISDLGNGYHFGIDTRLHIPLTGAYFRFKPEYRVLGDKYMPTYFNSMYLVSNDAFKYDQLKAEKAKNGYYMELGYDQYLLNSLLFNIKGTFEDYEGKNNSSILLFASVPLLDSFNFSAIYSKVGFDAFSDAFDLKDSLLIIEANVGVYGPLNLKVQYERTWYEDENGVLQYDSSWNFGAFVAFAF
jgi:hypothetical protein